MAAYERQKAGRVRGFAAQLISQNLGERFVARLKAAP